MTMQELLEALWLTFKTFVIDPFPQLLNADLGIIGKFYDYIDTIKLIVAIAVIIIVIIIKINYNRNYIKRK